MFLDIVPSDVSKMPPYFYKANEKGTIDVYFKAFMYHVLTWLKSTFPRSNYLFTQGGAPTHTSQRCIISEGRTWLASGRPTSGLRPHPT
uniref:Uncharacterized protein n=1 Tax=Lepeophtheirus salmonis TaxID=72036 RepID=A0A0K2UWG6_LEPSM